MNRKQIVRLNENQLKRLIKESVMNILNESSKKDSMDKLKTQDRDETRKTAYGLYGKGKKHHSSESPRIQKKSQENPNLKLSDDERNRLKDLVKESVKTTLNEMQNLLEGQSETEKKN